MSSLHTRINHKNDFELCYLRHQYLKRVKHNPTKEELDRYIKIVTSFSARTFSVYYNLFLVVGLDLEDILNISQIHLVSFLGLFALERTPDKLSEFKRNFRSHNSIKCTKEDILDKNKANFTCFLKQRLEDVVRVCRQKAKNIKGLVAEEYTVFRGNKKPPTDIEDLLLNHKQYEYNHIATALFKSIKKRMTSKQDGPVYVHDNIWYVCVPIRKNKLELTDFICNNVSPYDNLHNMTPEETFEKNETEETIENKIQEFNGSSNKQKAKIIKNFIEINGKKQDFKEEISIAKKLLENLNVRNI